MCITALRCGHARSCSEYGGMYLLDSEDASIKTASSDGWYGSYLLITLAPNTRSARVCARRRPDWLRLCADSSAYLQGGEMVRTSVPAGTCKCADVPPPPVYLLPLQIMQRYVGSVLLQDRGRSSHVSSEPSDRPVPPTKCDRKAKIRYVFLHEMYPPLL